MVQVRDYDLGFAVRLRLQGEGGAVESDLLPMEKISVRRKKIVDSIYLC